MDALKIIKHLCFICKDEAKGFCPQCDKVPFCCSEHLAFHLPNASKKCNPFVIKESDNVGRYLVASRDIEPGEIIFADAPFAVGLSSTPNLHCITCFKKVNSPLEEWLFKCTTCKFSFCSNECKDGRGHSKICSFFGQIPIQIHSEDIAECILPFQLYLLCKENSQMERLIEQLMDHGESKKQFQEFWTKVEKKWKKIINNNSVLQDIGLTLEKIVHLTGIVETNGHTIGTGYKGLYPLISLLSHCCISNSRQSILREAPFTASCRAKVLIKCGDEITTSYLPTYQRTAERLLNLSEGWHFQCSCLRCSDPKELGSMTSAVKCSTCSKPDPDFQKTKKQTDFVIIKNEESSLEKLNKLIDGLRCDKSSQGKDQGYLLPRNPLVISSDWFCVKCSHKESGQKIQQLVENLKNKVEESRDIEESLYTCLEKGRLFLHPNHQILTDIRWKLIPTYCRGPQTKLDDFPDEKFRTKLEMCLENKRVFDIVDPGFSTSRGRLFYEIPESIFQLGKTEYCEETMSRKEFLRLLVVCSELLNEGSMCLKNERANSTEKFFESMIKGFQASIANILETI